jgi:hypothetical protein
MPATSKVYTEPLMLRLTPEQRQRLEARATQEQRPVSQMARLLLDRALKPETKGRGGR